MTSIENSRARAVADLGDGYVLAGVEIGAPRERVFRALASNEIVEWWVRPGVFRMTGWTGDVRVGGRWRASGEVNGQPFTLEGEFLEVAPPQRLVHTWHRVGTPGAPTTVTYLLEALEDGTRITLRHAGFTSRSRARASALGGRRASSAWGKLWQQGGQPVSSNQQGCRDRLGPTPQHLRRLGERRLWLQNRRRKPRGRSPVFCFSIC